MTRRRAALAGLARDLAPVALVFAVCPLVALAYPTDPAAALRAAGWIAGLEADLGLAVEGDWSRWLAGHASVATVAAVFYLFVHLPATAGALIWLRVDRPERFARARDGLVAAQGLTVAGYLLWPVAPPRLAEPTGTPGAVSELMGSGADGVSAALQSPYAAMPSGHVAFAVIVGLVLWTERRSVPSWLALAYPALVSAVVIATANHWVLDVIGGVAVAVLGWTGATLRARLRAPDARVHDRRPWNPASRVWD